MHQHRSGLLTSCNATKIVPFEFRSKLEHQPPVAHAVGAPANVELASKRRRLEEWRKNP